MHHAWVLYHAGWLMYDAVRFVSHPSFLVALALGLGVLWFFAYSRKRS